MEEERSPALSRNSAVRQPSIAELTRIVNDFGFKCTEDEIKDMHEFFKDTTEAYQTVYDLVEPGNPVKYARTPGYRELSDNAWYWRCDVKGSGSGLLSGKTVGIKDNIALASVPMMAGSKLLEGYTPEFDATVVTRILDAGGRIIGKTSCEDLCVGGNSWTCSTGFIRNPYDITRSAGGSSSGSASLVARGLVDMSIGTCQGGSIRIPCSWCGIVGLKPTFGLVPYTGAIPLEFTIDHIGPITKTVYDCALMLEVLAGYDDGKDSRQNPNYVVPEYSKLLYKAKERIKVGLLKEGFEKCDVDVARCVRDAALSMTSSGAIVEEVSIPLHRHAASISLPINIEGKYNMMIRCNALGKNSKGRYSISLQEALTRGFKTRPFDTPITMKVASVWGEYIQRNYQSKFYSKAQNLNQLLTQAYDDVLKDYDVIVLPTATKKPFLLPTTDLSTLDHLKLSTTMFGNTAPFNTTGHPALSINAGFCERLPVGMTFVGRHYDDLTVLQAAHKFEMIRPVKDDPSII